MSYHFTRILFMKGSQLWIWCHRLLSCYLTLPIILRKLSKLFKAKAVKSGIFLNTTWRLLFHIEKIITSTSIFHYFRKCFVEASFCMNCCKQHVKTNVNWRIKTQNVLHFFKVINTNIKTRLMTMLYYVYCDCQQILDIFECLVC